MEITNDKRRQRTLYSEVLIYNEDYANTLFALRAYDHIV